MITSTNINIYTVLVIFTLQSQAASIPNILEVDSKSSPLKNESPNHTLNSSEMEFVNIAENIVEDAGEEDYVRAAATTQRKQSHIKPPLFIKLMHEKITEAAKDETSDLLVNATQSGSLLRAWLPLEISSDADSRSTSVHFQQTVGRQKIGNFTNARIILALRDDAQIAHTGWSIHLVIGKMVTRKPLHSNTKFYDFNITSYLERTLANTVEHPHPINLHFQVVHDEGHVFFLDHLFDVQVEQPFILLEFTNFPESLFSDLKRQRHHLHRRVPRSVSASTTEQSGSYMSPLPTTMAESPPNINSANLSHPAIVVVNGTVIPTPSMQPPSLACCRRHSLVVRPQELHWHNVFKPSSFDLGYCSGSCPYPMENKYYNFTLHTLLLDRYRFEKGIDAPANLPHSTCVPTRYKDVSVLLEDEDDDLAYDIRIYKTILVAECGCR